MSPDVDNFEIDDDFLQALRRAAQELLNPWPPAEPLESLSPARRRAVQDAAVSLVRLAQRESHTHRPPASGTKRTRNPKADLSAVNSDLEARVGVSLQELEHILVLDGIKGFGPLKFKALHDANVSPIQALSNPERMPIPGKIGDQLRDALGQVTEHDRTLARERAARQMVVASELGAHIVTYEHPAYSANVLRSNNPVPVIYVRGDLSVLANRRTVACVGSREIGKPYDSLQEVFARHAAMAGWTIASGFALGADTIAHSAAVAANGSTLCVMPSGLDRPFPPENRNRFEIWVSTPGVAFISEFPFGTGASSMTLRKRNKLIVAAAAGVLVGQSSVEGGAMNAFRFSLEQRKPVATFESDGTRGSTGNSKISGEVKVPVGTFPLEAAPREWDEWLSLLS